MKIKPPTLIAGISALLFLTSNLLYVALGIWNGSGLPEDAILAGWILSFLFEMPSIIIVALLYRKRVFLFLGLIFFVLGQVIWTLFGQLWYGGGGSIPGILQNIVNWPSINIDSGFSVLWTIANLFLFFGTCLFFVAFVLALLSKDTNLTAKQDHNFAYGVVTTVADSSLNSNQKSTIDDPYVQIEKLGELMTKGLITQAEFTSKKKKILDL